MNLSPVKRIISRAVRTLRVGVGSLRGRRRVGLVTILPIVLAVAAVPAQQPLMESPSRPPQVGLAPGDTVEAHFIDFPEASDLHLTVSPEGNLFVPYAGEIKVAGLMPDEAKAAIVESLKSKDVVKEPQVALTVLAARNLSAMVVGEVVQPRPVQVYSPTPLSAVLAQVGGFTPLANHHILIAPNDGRPATEVDLDYSLHDTKAMEAEVRPGDVVAVLRADSFYAVGEVQRPGMFPIVGSDHLTLLQAIATAGGPTNTAQLSQSRVFRRQKDGTRLEITVDFAKLSKGQVSDLLVQADDIIFFPRSGVRFLYNNWLSQSLNASIIAASYFK